MGRFDLVTEWVYRRIPENGESVGDLSVQRECKNGALPGVTVRGMPAPSEAGMIKKCRVTPS